MPRPAAGYIYVLEATAGVVKVGWSARPDGRLDEHARDLRRIGLDIQRRWVSPRHAEASENENRLIAACLRMGGQHRHHRTEWFTELSFDDAVEAAQALPFTESPEPPEPPAAPIAAGFGWLPAGGWQEPTGRRAPRPRTEDLKRWDWEGAGALTFGQLRQVVAKVVLRAAEDYGFALAGGNALIMHGVIDRYTADVDIFTDEADGVEAVADVVEEYLTAAGFEVERRDKTAGLTDIFPEMGQGLAEWILTAPSGEEVQLQLSYFFRARRPVVIDGITVLDLEDVAAGKACAFAGRAMIRDYVDMAALLDHYDTETLMRLAFRQDHGLRKSDFADAARRLDRMPDEAFARYGFTPEQITWIRTQFKGWPR